MAEDAVRIKGAARSARRIVSESCPGQPINGGRKIAAEYFDISFLIWKGPVDPGALDRRIAPRPAPPVPPGSSEPSHVLPRHESAADMQGAVRFSLTDLILDKKCFM